MRKFFLILLTLCVIAAVSCKSGTENENTSSEPAATTASETPSENANPSYDPDRGDGKFKDVKLKDKLDAALASSGEKVFTVKCSSCHKLTDEKLVGPGWLGVTSRHKPEWIMNFVTNTDEMLNKDPKAQAMLEICLVRMPNQSLTDEDARNILEFMRKNDGVK